MRNDRTHLDRERSELQPLLDELKIAGAKADLRPGSCYCPYHENTNTPAASIREKDGVWRFNCFSCGAKGDVFDLRALNRRCDIKDVFREAGQNASPRSSSPRPNPMSHSKSSKKTQQLQFYPTMHDCIDGMAATMKKHGGWELVHEYLYGRELGVPLAVALRFERDERDPETNQVFRDKTLRQAHLGKDGRWTNQGMPAPRPLYREPTIRAAAKAGKTIVVVEGEKTTAALVVVGYEATTNMGGANAAGNTDWSALAGAPDVVIWRDADGPGEKHLAAVLQQLAGLTPPPKCVRIVDVSGLPESHDAADCTQYEMDRRIGAATPCALPSPAPATSAEAVSVGAVVRRMSDIGERPVNWLWKPYLAEGMSFIFAGPPGIGKTFVGLDCAARITRGQPFPFEAQGRPPQSVIIWAEDPAEYILRPRLRAAGADLERVHVLGGKRVMGKDGKERVEPLNLTDLSEIEQAIKDVGDCALLIIDPVNAYFGQADTHKQSEVASLLTPFVELATKHRIAVLFVHHFNKSSGGSGENRLGGSVAFRSSVRGVSYVTKDHEDESLRWLAVSKSNIGIDRGGLSYRLVDSDVPGFPRVDWIEHRADMDGNTNACDIEEEYGGAALDNALNEALHNAADQELDFGVLKGIGEQLAGYGKHAVRAGLKRLGATSHKKGFGKGSHTVWRLPSKKSAAPVSPETMGSLESTDSLDSPPESMPETGSGEVIL